MELDDFVSETLKQIMVGVQTAQRELAPTGALVNPTSLRRRGGGTTHFLEEGGTGALLERVEFDVAVTLIEGKGTKGGIGIFAGPVGVGSQGESQSTNQSVSRIKFSIPVTFPPAAGGR